MIKDELEKKTDEILEEKPLEEEVNEEIKKDVVDKEPVEDIQNIDLSVFKKKRFSINGDPNTILELDVGDLNILTRLQEQSVILEKLSKKIAKLSDTDNTLDDKELLDKIANGLKEIDTEMRKCIDTIFDAPVSEICVPRGSMYDPIGGKLRYEHLIDTLITLYNDNLVKEVKKLQNKVSKHTNKYTKKK